MADLEAVLADVSYLMAMEKSKTSPAARANKKIVLPNPRFVIASVYCCINLVSKVIKEQLLQFAQNIDNNDVNKMFCCSTAYAA